MQIIGILTIDLLWSAVIIRALEWGRTHRGNHFHFEASWLLEEDCAEVIQNTWTSAFLKQSMTVHEALQRTACELMDWNKKCAERLVAIPDQKSKE